MKQKKIITTIVVTLLFIFGVGCANTTETEEVSTVEKEELDIHVEPTQEIYETKDETVKTKDLLAVHANDYEGDILFYPEPTSGNKSKIGIHDDSDTVAISEGYVTLTPLCLDFVYHKMIDEIKDYEKLEI